MTLLFELALRSSPEGPGIGRPHPVLLVLEEAHRYLGQEAAASAREATSKIAREGRKYGVGLMLVSQRPSELPDTALSQCGTLIALRLTNSSDQGRIRSALPDSIEGLSAVLPSLRTGEALVSGEAITLPARVLVNRPNPMPQSEDPSTEVWRREKELPDVTVALLEWRGVYQEEKEAK
ncbi:MAG: ATP-binding protein [Chloroflexota bacterium]|nr:ATP-binding protein [Chloroflexota bacterium]